MTLESFFFLFRPFFGGTGFVLALVGGVVAYSPRAWLDEFGLLNFRLYQRAEFALCFWVGIAILIAVQCFDKKSILQRELHRLGEWRKAAASKSKLRDRLQRLTPDEKALLVRFVKPPRASLKLGGADGTVLALAKQGFLYPTVTDIMKTTYSLMPQVRAALIEHPAILDDATPPRVP